MISRAKSRAVSTFSEVASGGGAAASSSAVLQGALLEDFRTAVTVAEGHYRPGGYDRQVEKALAFAKYRLETSAANVDALACHTLTEDQIAAMHLYTQESPFYIALDGAMGGWGDGGRDALVHYVPYISLALSGLRKLPTVSTTVYRILENVQVDTFLQGRVAGDIITFTSFSTVSESPDIADFATIAEVSEVAEQRIVLKIVTDSGIWIKPFSDLGTNVNDYHGYQQFVPEIEEPKKEIEDPILLLPGIQYTIDAIDSFELGVTQVSLHEILPDSPCKYNCGFQTNDRTALAEHHSTCSQFYMQPSVHRSGDNHAVQRDASTASYLEPVRVGDDYEYGQDMRLRAETLANLGNAVSFGASSATSQGTEGSSAKDQKHSMLNNLDEDGYLASTNIPGGIMAAMQSNGFDSDGYSFPSAPTDVTGETGATRAQSDGEYVDAAEYVRAAGVATANHDPGDDCFDPTGQAMYFRATSDASALNAKHPIAADLPRRSETDPIAAPLAPQRSESGTTHRMSVEIDTTGDGHANIRLVDTTGDGIPDTVVQLSPANDADGVDGATSVSSSAENQKLADEPAYQNPKSAVAEAIVQAHFNPPEEPAYQNPSTSVAAAVVAAHFNPPPQQSPQPALSAMHNDMPFQGATPAGGQFPYPGFMMKMPMMPIVPVIPGGNMLLATNGATLPLNARGPKLRAHHKVQGMKRPAARGQSFEQLTAGLKAELAADVLRDAQHSASSASFPATEPDYNLDPTKHPSIVVAAPGTGDADYIAVDGSDNATVPVGPNSIVVNGDTPSVTDDISAEYIVVNGDDSPDEPPSVGDASRTTGWIPDGAFSNDVTPATRARVQSMDVEELWHTSAAGSWVARGKFMLWDVRCA
jgi:hypothetical protein